MSNGLAIACVYAFLAVAVPAAYCRIRKAMNAELERDRIIRDAYNRPGATVWDPAVEEWVTLPPGVLPGPGQLPEEEVAEIRELRLLFEAPAFDRAAAHLADGLTDLFEELGPPPLSEKEEEL